MRNPLSSIVSLTSSINPFTLVPDLESAVPSLSSNTNTTTASRSRFRKRGSRTRSSSTSHQRPHTALSGASSYASAFRTPLPTLTPTRSIDLGAVNVREEENTVLIEAPVATMTKLQVVPDRRIHHFSEGEAFTAAPLSGFEVGNEKTDHKEDSGLGYGLSLTLHARGNGVDTKTDVEREASLRALLDKYDPREQVGRAIWGQENHREMVGQMLLDCILVAAGRLRRHGWIMGSQNELFRNACTHERWDRIHEDLLRYTNAIEAYETWQKREIQTIEFGPLDLPLRSDRYGRVLAVIEIASRSEDPEERAAADDLSRSLMHSHATWWRSHVWSRNSFSHASGPVKKNPNAKASLGSRIGLTLFGALALLAPMLIMVLQPGLMSRLVTTSLFTVAVACILGYFMTEASQSSLMAMAAAYAAVLVVFVGSGAGA